jgi:hypothetical protein
VDAITTFFNTPLGQRVLISVLSLLIGGLIGWAGSKWRRYRQRRQVETGDAREVVTIEKVLVDRDADGREAMRIRSCGRDPIDSIFPNPAARDAFHERALATTSAQPLISMDSKMGSYLLQELAIWVCGQVGERDFPHDVWVMAAACEAAALGGHKSSTVILIRREDLAKFKDWAWCRQVRVEHGGHGERVLTLRSMAVEFERQAVEVERRRAEGKRSNYEETMYILDLGLDARAIGLPTKPVPWNRFEATLRALGIE